MTQWGLDTLFNPAKRHMDEEKRRLQSTREEVGDTSGGKRIDLESGKVVIRRATDDADEAQEGAADAADASEAPDAQAAPAADDATDEQGKDSGAESRPQPSPAAIRAARRRGREPR